MKKLRKVAALLLCLAMSLAFLCSCGDNSANNDPDTNEGGIITVLNSPADATGSDENATPLDEATGLTFDCNTLTYSFTGVDNAQFYYIKVFPVENGQESNSASFQSDKIDATEGNTYSGTIEGEILLAGDYQIHVVASASGYKSSDVSISGTSIMLASASLSANWNTDDPENTTAKITVTPGDEITQSFSLSVLNADGAEVYTNANVPAGELVLTAADLGAESLSTEDKYTVTLSVNPVTGYTLPVANEVSVEITEARGWGFPGGGPGGPGGPG